MPDGMRSALGLISLFSGIATTVIGVVTFVSNHSWDAFLFRAGLVALVGLGIGVIVVLAEESQPAREGDEVRAPPVESPLEAVVVPSLVMIAMYAAFGVVLLALGVVGLSEFELGDFVRMLGAVAIFTVPLAIAVGWSDVAAAITGGGSSRPSPRCGHPVPAGKMKCQSCGFDFWTIGDRVG